MDYKEAEAFKIHNYEVEITGDGSPTLRPQQKESMHHMGGAAGESVYIYYQALLKYAQIESEKKSIHDLSVLSFGFGMGYNEILAVLYFLKGNGDLKKLKLFSHEKDLFLYDLFNDWLFASVGSKSVFDDVYTGINTALASYLPEIPLVELKKSMIWLLENKNWIQAGPVVLVGEFTGIYDVVFYDAFSSKTNGYLWTEEFLNDFFKTRLNPAFVFSTYACTGVLKQVAANNQSEFVKRDGYKGKRNASLIYRT